MNVNFKFSQLFGSVYKNGNVVFTSDGNTIISPVGNKVSVFDLKNNVSRTLGIETRTNITSLALDPYNSKLIIATEGLAGGQVLIVNLLTETVIYKMAAKRHINALLFSPDGRQVALTRGGDVQIHDLLSTSLNAYRPLHLSYSYQMTAELLTSLDWSFDGRLLAAGGEDKIVRVVGNKPICNAKVVNLGSHKADLVCAQFFDNSYDLVSVDRRGQANCWTSNLAADDIIYGEWKAPKNDPDAEKAGIKYLQYEKNTKTNVCDASGSGRSVSVSSARLHAPSKILATAFSNGVFVLHEVPSFSLIHSLRVSEVNVTTVAISPMGDWLALGCGRHSQGQLLVWEWQSETYVMKQQSHQLAVKSAQFSPDASLIATAGDDGKVKIWNCRSSFCIATFDEHTAAATGVAWTQSGRAVLSSSLDGTVRARDLKRYRNFRTLVCPEPTPLGSVAVDDSGDIVVAAAIEQFQIMMWSLGNGQLLDVLSGHTANIASIALKGSVIASTAWDNSLRVWKVVDSSCEKVDLTGEGVAVAFAPTRPLIAALTLDSLVAFINSDTLTHTSSIDVKFDVDSGRQLHDKIKKDTSERTKSFTSLSFSPDSSLLLLGGQSNHFSLYSVDQQLLLRKFTMTANASLDGVQLDINRRNYSEFGNMQLIEDSDEEEDGTLKKAIQLAGVRNADKGERKAHLLAEVHQVSFCPTGRRFLVCSTEGVQMYSLDTTRAFDPFLLDLATSTEEVHKQLSRGEYSGALKGALQLGDSALIKRCIEVTLIVCDLSLQYCIRLLTWMADTDGLVATTRLHMYMTWLNCLMNTHGGALKRKGEVSLLTAVQQAVQHHHKLLASLTADNGFSLEYLMAARKMKRSKKDDMEE